MAAKKKVSSKEHDMATAKLSEVEQIKTAIGAIMGKSVINFILVAETGNSIRVMRDADLPKTSLLLSYMQAAIFKALAAGADVHNVGR